MRIELPVPCLVVLMGASGSGKSTFAATHFKPTEVISSDFCRALVSDDANDQSATQDAFAVLHEIAGRRMKRGLLTVIDATNVQRESRAPLVALAREHDLFPVALILDTPERDCQARNATRADRDFGEHVIRRQSRELHRSLRHLEREGFRYRWVIKPGDEVEFTRSPLWTDRRHELGPFDVIGDVHGCFDELVALLEKLGYVDGVHPEGRRLAFVGDYVDRGPKTPEVLRLLMGLEHAILVPGNHDNKLARKLSGRDVKVTHGLAESLEQLEAQPIDGLRTWLDGLTSHAVLDEGRLVVAHAGMPERYQGRASRRVRAFALYGETTGETDEFGLPVRGAWANDYRGTATVVYGHTPVPDPEWVNNTVNIDTGCVFGGALTALRWPERELVSVPAARTYYEPARPFLDVPDARPGQLLDLDDVAGKRIIQTRLARTITIREDLAAGALEVMSRFAVDPRWLVYLPPTMAPTATSKLPDALEHPAEAFAEFRAAGIAEVVCEEKHMGSRAIAVVCREDGLERFGIEGIGALYTRTGRPFLDDNEPALERIRAAATRAGLWEKLDTDWLVLDCELLPWSAKAMELIRRQYAAVGAAGSAALTATAEVLGQASARGLADAQALLDTTRDRLARVERYRTAYAAYMWDVNGLEDLRLAPFHILAAESGAFTGRDHRWHLEHCDALVAADPDWFRRTDRRIVDVTDRASEAEATAWWETMTAAGGEGMVVKPMAFTATGAQPGLKCRGREYLRIIYGPEYDAPSQIDRLRSRSLGRKRSMASREFALGVEALERFTRREPLYRVHECVFAVLALESEPVDPRL